MALLLPNPAAHCQERWLKRLHPPAGLRSAIGKCFLMSYPPPPPRRKAGIAAVCAEAPACPSKGRPLCGLSGAPRPGKGPWHDGGLLT